jgi:tetratricopeptide (TPR) repeat protein
LGNAADFFLLADNEKAEQLLKRAQKLEPDSVKWMQRLGRLFQHQSHRADAEAKKELSKKALEEFERAIKGMDDRQIYVHLDDLAKTAFAAGEDQKAEKYAKRLLSLKDENENGWNSGNAVHHGNLILGRVALRAGDVNKAKDYLLKAGATKGSPQLDSFGPNMALAKELLDGGEREVVLEYFTRCGKFWDRDELKAWREQVEQGKTPQFGANLVY